MSKDRKPSNQKMNQDSKKRKLSELANDVLNEREHRPAESKLLWEVIDSYDYDNGKLWGKIHWYKYFGLVVLISIPVLSTIIAASINVDEHFSGSMQKMFIALRKAVPTLSLVLAILSTLNSIFKPSERFVSACHLGNALSWWRFEFLKGLKVKEIQEDAAFADYLEAQRKSLIAIQERHMTLALPEQL